MKLLVFIIIQLSYYINSYDYFIGNETSITIRVPKSEEHWLVYKFIINIDICDYVKNDSYIIEGNSHININENYYKKYNSTYDGKEIKIYGSDLKFINYAVTFSLCFHTPYNFSISNDGNKYQIIVDNNCSPSFHIYIIKNDYSDFINLCNLYNNPKNIIFYEGFSFNSKKERILEFELDPNLDSGTYKVVLIAEDDSMLIKYKPQL